jgi:fatty acid desaturase
MKGMSLYYASRAIVSTAFGVLFYLSGNSLWMALLIGSVAFAWFLWAPHSGRYAVHPEFGITALQRDEHTQQINDQAARNAFIVLSVAIAILSSYFGSVIQTDIPTRVLNYALILGALTYFVSDFQLRRS